MSATIKSIIQKLFNETYVFTGAITLLELTKNSSAHEDIIIGIAEFMHEKKIWRSRHGWNDDKEIYQSFMNYCSNKTFSPEQDDKIIDAIWMSDDNDLKRKFFLNMEIKGDPIFKKFIKEKYGISELKKFFNITTDISFHLNNGFSRTNENTKNSFDSIIKKIKTHLKQEPELFKASNFTLSKHITPQMLWIYNEDFLSDKIDLNYKKNIKEFITLLYRDFYTETLEFFSKPPNSPSDKENFIFFTGSLQSDELENLTQKFNLNTEKELLLTKFLFESTAEDFIKKQTFASFITKYSSTFTMPFIEQNLPLETHKKMFNLIVKPCLDYMFKEELITQIQPDEAYAFCSNPINIFNTISERLKERNILIDKSVYANMERLLKQVEEQELLANLKAGGHSPKKTIKTKVF